jgi:hypothetical protein
VASAARCVTIQRVITGGGVSSAPEMGILCPLVRAEEANLVSGADKSENSLSAFAVVQSFGRLMLREYSTLRA